MSALGTPHLHLRATTSTNDRARELAARGAPHGALVTAAEQSAGRGRQGRAWSAPAGCALLLSVLVRRPLELLPLAAGVAVAAVVGGEARIKWPNDVLVADRKIAGILVEGRPQEGWAVIGVGVNVAVQLADLPAELRGSAATMGLERDAIPGVRDALLDELDAVLRLAPGELLDAYRERDALAGRRISWATGTGTAAGIDGAGRLIVALDAGGQTELDAGEVHLTVTPAP